MPQLTEPCNTLNACYELDTQWQLFKTKPGQFTSPKELFDSQLTSIEAIVPGTVAMALNQIESAPIWEPHFKYDDHDWWYSTEFSSQPDHNFEYLQFLGLATLCEVWLNGEMILSSQNMFIQHHVLIKERLKANNHLAICFRSVESFLQQRHPRPRWKTKLVDNQHMRWVRQTVLGRVDVWTPPFTPIGPWRKIQLQPSAPLTLSDYKIHAFSHNNQAMLKLAARLELNQLSNTNLSAYIEINGAHYPLQISQHDSYATLSIDTQINNAELWWPHTHGTPQLYEYQLIVSTEQQNICVKQGQLGFKSVELVSNQSTTQFKLNHQLIFCRGTCWTVSDYFGLDTDLPSLEKHLQMLKQSGLNMIRVGGTMIYESDNFYQLCDKLGILVWQDFMFASMDYPTEDANFQTNIETETYQQVQRLSQHACLALFCGNTDIAAQAAMFGMPEPLWSNEFFDTYLPKVCNQLAQSIPYIPSSPSGGVLPFHLDQGVAHFWSVGAYRHPTESSDQHRIKFASEGMGLPHIPEDETIQLVSGKQTLFPYSNQWNLRTPRDLGAGWDFEDIRNFYLNDIFKVNANDLKRSHVDKFIALSRVVTGEAISRVFRQWRKFDSDCNGGLIWFNKDFWPCAGFGIIDSQNIPKASYFQLQNVWASRAALITNEGLNGAFVTLINEHPKKLKGKLKINLIKYPNTSVAQTEKTISVDSNEKLKVSVEEAVGGFYDTGYAYRFGPPQFDIIHCELLDCEQNELCIHQDYLFTHDQLLPEISEPNVSATATVIDENKLLLTLSANVFMQYVRIKVKGYSPQSNYFHLAANRPIKVMLNANDNATARFRGEVSAFNLTSTFPITLQEND
ncbi:glycoside hydrolase family 2 protein [Aliikangiella sp. IMCC44632]